MDDRQLQQEVLDQLDFDPSIDAAHIGVTADNGVVTLTGHVFSYAEKLAVEQAARRVKGVRAVAQEIEVRYPSDKKTADDEIAKRAISIIKWDTMIRNRRSSDRSKRPRHARRPSPPAISKEGR